MSDFGAKLREARERRGVSLRTIAAHTKFPIAALEALERNDSSRLPGGIFARAVVRSYAAHVGLDPEATVREFVERFDVEPALSTLDVSRLHAGRGGDGRSSVIPAVLKLVVITLVAMAIIFYFTRPRSTEESSGVTPANARRTSRRVGSFVLKSRQLP